MGKNIGPGQIQVITGLDIGAVIYSGGIEFVTSGGVAIDAMVNSAGSQFVFGGGKTYDTTVNLGGVQTVGAGGKAYSTGVNQGGLQVVSYGGETDFAIMDRGSQYLKGASYFSELMNGGTETVAASGQAYYTKIDANSLQDVLANGYAEFTDIWNTGKQTVEAGALAEYTSVHSGGLEVVKAGGQADYTTVALSGVQDIFGSTSHAAVYGLQKVENGGTDQSADIFSGGAQEVFGGGTAIGAIVHQGGVQEVWQGHTALTDILSGGKEIVTGGAYRTSIEDGGQLLIESGGIGNQTRIATGGDERVYGGGMEYDAIFKGAGMLDLDSASCVGLIEGWQAGAKVDLRDIGFGANTTFGYDSATGIFSITDGQHSSSLQLWGQYAASDFSLSSDGHGGTLITDPFAGVPVPAHPGS
jgi:autotransporter passenger strand-loop-strand repeat protein